MVPKPRATSCWLIRSFCSSIGRVPWIFWVSAATSPTSAERCAICWERSAILAACSLGLGAQSGARLRYQFRRSVRRGDELARSAGETGLQRSQPGDVKLGLDEVAVGLVLVRRRLGRVQLEQQLSAPDVVAILDEDGPNRAGVQRLDRLHVARWQDPARRGGVDVDLAKEGPGDGHGEEPDDQPGEEPQGGRGWRLHHLEGRRQELTFVLGLEQGEHPLDRMRKTS